MEYDDYYTKTVSAEVYICKHCNVDKSSAESMRVHLSVVHHIVVRVI